MIMPKVKSKKTTKSNAGRVFYYFGKTLWQHKFLTLGLLLVIPLNTLFSAIFVPIGASEMIGRLSSGDFEFTNYIPLLIFTAASAIIPNLILIRIADILDWALDAKGGLYLSNLAFNAIITQSMTFHNNRFSGSLTSQANKFASAFMRLKSNIVWDLYPLIMVIIMTIVTVFFISPLFALVLMATTSLYATVAIVTFRKTRHIDEALPAAENKQTGQLADSITNIVNVKSYAREGYERGRFNKVAKNTYHAVFGVAKVSMWRNFLLNFINIIAFIALLCLIISGHNLFGLTIANIVLVYTLTNQLLSQMWTLNHVLRAFNSSIGDAKEMVEVLDTPTTVTDQTDRELAVHQATIDFHDITFQHEEQKTPLFDNFSLQIPAGERVGLVGISGSGKTTLTKLLLRFADVNQGEILIDGQDISFVTQESLRRHIAYVPQETALFHRSIFENIAYGKPDATLEEVKKAARQANAEEFIKDLPHGYDTLVGERGVKLSGGQRQRIAIARAILKDAPILVLDEATSALDSESEELIQDALRRLMKDRTSLVIAHRLSTVASLDRIVVLKNGKIIEQGTHQQLIKQSGEYAKLWDRQTGAFLDTDVND